LEMATAAGGVLSGGRRAERVEVCRAVLHIGLQVASLCPLVPGVDGDDLQFVIRLGDEVPRRFHRVPELSRRVSGEDRRERIADMLVDVRL
jgi:hypothetical protein